jgi:hypothetical protein
MNAITRGGKAVFDLQHYHAFEVALHPAEIIITSATIEFVPEGSCKYPAFAIPLDSIKSVEMGRNDLDHYLLNIKFDNSHNKKGKETKGQLSFSEPSALIGANSRMEHRQPMTLIKETALFSTIRNVILNAKGKT